MSEDPLSRHLLAEYSKKVKLRDATTVTLRGLFVPQDRSEVGESPALELSAAQRADLGTKFVRFRRNIRSERPRRASDSKFEDPEKRAT